MLEFLLVVAIGVGGGVLETALSFGALAAMGVSEAVCKGTGVYKFALSLPVKNAATPITAIAIIVKITSIQFIVAVRVKLFYAGIPWVDIHFEDFEAFSISFSASSLPLKSLTLTHLPGSIVL